MTASRDTNPIPQALEQWAKNREDLALAWSAAATKTPRYRSLALVLSGWLLGRAGRSEAGVSAVRAGLVSATENCDALVAVAAATLLRDHRPDGDDTEDGEMNVLSSLGVRKPGPPSMAPMPTVERLRGDGEQLLDDAEACLRQAAAESDGDPGDSVRGGFLSKLDGPSLQALGEVASLRVVGAGQPLIRSGETGTEAFVVVRGQLEVCRPDSPPVLIGTGAVLGEIALLTDAPRGADVVAIEPCLLLVVGRAELARLMERHQKLADALARSLRDRVVANLYSSNPMLRRASAADRATLLSHLELRSFSPGESLIEQGSENTGLFFIAAGRVRIVHDDGEPIEIAQVTSGDTVGEVALMLRRPATAAAIAQSTVVALRLAPERLLAALRPLPELFVDLYALALTRETETTEISEAETGEADEIILV